MNYELLELNDLVDKFNEGCKPLLEWVKKHQGSPFLDTKDGQDVWRHIVQISTGAGLLNLKMAILFTQDLIIERLIDKMNEDN